MFFACKDCLFPDSALIMHTCSNVSVEEWMKKSSCCSYRQFVKRMRYAQSALWSRQSGNKYLFTKGFTLGVVDARPYVVNRRKTARLFRKSRPRTVYGNWKQLPDIRLQMILLLPFVILLRKRNWGKVVPFIAGTAKIMQLSTSDACTQIRTDCNERLAGYQCFPDSHFLRFPDHQCLWWNGSTIDWKTWWVPISFRMKLLTDCVQAAIGAIR